MSYFSRHVFFCLNDRKEGKASCAHRNAEAMQAYAKQRIKQKGLNGPGAIRINKAGCLDRCEFGPVLVVYPEGTWYTYLDAADIDEIVDEHLVNGRVVERLLLDPPEAP